MYVRTVLIILMAPFALAGVVILYGLAIAAVFIALPIIAAIAICFFLARAFVAPRRCRRKSREA